VSKRIPRTETRNSPSKPCSKTATMSTEHRACPVRCRVVYGGAVTTTAPATLCTCQLENTKTALRLAKTHLLLSKPQKVDSQQYRHKEAKGIGHTQQYRRPPSALNAATATNALGDDSDQEERSKGYAGLDAALLYQQEEILWGGALIIFASFENSGNCHLDHRSTGARRDDR
jgi:hypothetical protein